MKAKSNQPASTERQIAVLLINTREKAEDFIEKYMKRHKVGRNMAVMRLRELGVKLSRLPMTV